MVNKSSNVGYLKGFNVNDNVSYNLLQFADDTILLSDGDWVNLWAFKAILMGFEMIWGLQVNTDNSCLYGVCIEDYYLKAVEQFLACRIGHIPFKFLGLKAPRNILEQLISIQRNFLWHGSDEKKIMAWVSWESIRMPKEGENLGVKDLRLFNLEDLAIKSNG
ncbi:unnamed protein product [Lathyrus sativus]|nr:unnamed protein product [Lathyrus sativus]